MDEEVGVGAGPAERAPHAGGGGPAPRRRMSAGRKREAVLRLLRGEDLELVSRELGVTAAELSGWREAFLAAGEVSLKSRPADARDAEIGRLKAKVGELTMANELLGAKVERLEAGRPSARGRSRRWAGKSRPPPPAVRDRAGHAPVGRRAGDRLPPPPPGSRRRPGPVGAMPDAALLGEIRKLPEDSPFHGEGYRKLRARLRFAGIRTSRRRVLRLAREHGLLAHRRPGRRHGPRAHDGTITTDRVDLVWGTTRPR